jgi:hypothetical protein
MIPENPEENNKFERNFMLQNPLCCSPVRGGRIELSQDD